MPHRLASTRFPIPSGDQGEHIPKEVDSCRRQAAVPEGASCRAPDAQNCVWQKKQKGVHCGDSGSAVAPPQAADFVEKHVIKFNQYVSAKLLHGCCTADGSGIHYTGEK
jgi:hypothetical protein